MTEKEHKRILESNGNIIYLDRIWGYRYNAFVRTHEVHTSDVNFIVDTSHTSMGEKYKQILNSS